ncbi:class I SAM-dependent methyltransferase [Roseobacter sinensis]|uniref:Class I SAM-dependent methyltransferase n=1 Tax=Roseobacter sinensis TaxID=2931391 RepID=A0ABT3BCJ9_9RHOB|nr:class I SAM-dependent methyltransferase [Roseobacter sp. WL0113]MCV3271285.1 class I SAM-dependent methyltransferase [Roseobacter sp. WL0113]
MHTTLPQNHPASFWDRIAPKYAKKPVKDPTAYAEKLETVRELVKPTDIVLELGCGTGTTAIKLAPYVAAYTATDVSPAMIRIAEEKNSSAPVSNLRFAVADASRVAGERPFDVVLAFSLLHLVDDLPVVLRAVHDQLRPGGFFLSKTVCLGEGNIAIRGLVRALTAVGVAPKVRSLTKDDLLGALDDARFEIDSCTQFGSGRITPFIVARRRD